MLRRRALIAALLVTLAAPAGVARASAYSDVLGTYQHKGTIPPCQYPGQVLTNALKGVDTYGAQYFADFTAAIQTALDAQASGACAVRHGSQTAASPGHVPAAPVPLRSLTAPTDSGFPAPLVMLAALAVLAALSAAVWRLAVTRGWDPAPVAAWRHAWQETGYRLGGTWAEFVDWLRSA